MSEQKSLLHHLGEAFDHYRTERHTTIAHESVPKRTNSLIRFLRWMVPNGGTLLLILVLILTQRVWARPSPDSLNVPGPSATTVNYQGRLANPAGDPLDGSFAMSFSLWDTPSAGNLVWGPENHAAVPVAGGLFSVGLGSQTSGGIPTNIWDGDRYLEITVGGETLSPRELIRSVPIAGLALSVSSNVLPNAILDDNPRPVLMQSGRVDNTVDPNPAYIIVTFSQPFKTGTVPRVIVSPNSQSGDWPADWYVVLQNNAGFRIYRLSDCPVSWDWVAIGESAD